MSKRHEREKFDRESRFRENARTRKQEEKRMKKEERRAAKRHKKHQQQRPLREEVVHD